MRRAKAYDADQTTFSDALRRLLDAAREWAALMPRSRRIVAACVHGHEVSQGVAQALLETGFDAAYLEGGITAWTDAGAPIMTKQPELGLPGEGNSRWITRERSKIDRVACPWLICRFIDPLAEFLYVPSSEVLAAAQWDKAIPYDVPDVTFSHRGERCSFDTFIEDFGLRDPALDAVAAIVRGADIGNPGLTPQSPGLLAISLGLSANFPDDHAMLEQGMVVYDALYAWLGRARGEVHNAKLFEKT